MNGLAQDLKSAFRQLRRSPALAAVIIATVAIGVGANTAIFSVVRGVLLRPLPYREPERLVRIQSQWRVFGQGAVSLIELRDYQRSLKRVSAVAGWQYLEANLAGTGAPEHVRVQQGTAELFPILGLTPEIGRWYSKSEEGDGKQQVAVISHALWKRRFGSDPKIAGKSLLLDGQSVTIIGVAPPAASIAPGGHRYDRAALDLFMPLAYPPAQESEAKRSNHNLRAIARLAPGRTLGELRAELAVAAAQANLNHPVNYPAEAGFAIAATPLSEEMVGGVRDSLWMLFAAVGLVLLIACANVANLLLAKATSRERELAVRAALGAGRLRILRQLLIESVVLSLAGGVCGVVIALFSVDALLGLASGSLPRTAEVTIDLPVLAFAVGVAALTGVVFGLVPALSAARSDLHQSLSGAGHASSAPRPRRLRRALVVAEVALALVLLAAGGVLLRSFSRVLSVSPGFRTEGVVAMRVALPPSPISNPTPAQQAADDLRIRRFWTEALQRLRSLPGADSSGAVRYLPMSGIGNDQLFDVEGLDVPLGRTPPDEELRVVVPGFFETLGVPLLRGRSLTIADDAKAPDVVVVNQAFAQKYWPGQDAVGRRMRLQNAPPGAPNTASWATVVGVVGDVHEFGLDADVKPIMYFPEDQTASATTSLNLVVHGAGSEEALAAASRAALRDVDPALPVFDVRPMRELLDGSLSHRRFALVLLESFAALALLLAALGLYGVMSYSVAQRTHEIGVRMALGAQRAEVLGLVAREGARLVILGIVFGGIGALAATRLIAGLLYRTSPADPLGFAGGALITPMVALRAE
jgi:predicted permease